MKILFSGLGWMGLPMSKNLSKSAHKVIGYDILKENLDRAAQQYNIPAYWGENDLDVIITMMPSAHNLNDFFFESNVLNIENQVKKPLIIDCSTIGPM